MVYYSTEATFIAYKGVISANGITANKNQTLVYVSAFQGSTLDILRPGFTDNFFPPLPSSSPPSHQKKTVEDLNRLIFVESVKLGFANDNVFYDTLTDSLLIAGHPKILEIVAGFEEPEGVPMESASRIVQVSRNWDQQQPSKKASMPWFSLSKWSKDWRKDRYLVKTVLEDGGKGDGGISTATTAALYRRRKEDGGVKEGGDVMLIATGFSVRGLWKCPVPEGV